MIGFLSLRLRTSDSVLSNPIRVCTHLNAHSEEVTIVLSPALTLEQIHPTGYDRPGQVLSEYNAEIHEKDFCNSLHYPHRRHAFVAGAGG